MSTDLTVQEMNIISELYFVYTIRIYHECEDGIEKSILRIIGWHREACQMITNGDHEGWIFLFHLYTNNGIFLLTT